MKTPSCVCLHDLIRIQMINAEGIARWRGSATSTLYDKALSQNTRMTDTFLFWIYIITRARRVFRLRCTVSANSTIPPYLLMCRFGGIVILSWLMDQRTTPITPLVANNEVLPACSFRPYLFIACTALMRSIVGGCKGIGNFIMAAAAQADAKSTVAASSMSCSSA